MRIALIVLALTFVTATPLFSLNAQNTLVVCADPPRCTFEEFVKTIDAVIQFAVTIGASIVAIMFAYAGWLYMTGGDNSGKRSEAKKVLTTSITGFFIVLAAWLLVKLIVTGLLIDSRFKNVLPK